jgi:hypothetical protein
VTPIDRAVLFYGLFRGSPPSRLFGSWRSTLPMPATLGHGIFGWRALSSALSRRLASEMISTPRSTSRRLRQSVLEGLKQHPRRLAADVLDRLDDIGEARGTRGRGH